MAALAFALFNAYRQVDRTEAVLAVVEARNLLLRARLGEQADQQTEQYSICFFEDSYSSGDELRWRIKTPDSSGYRLMYAKGVAEEDSAPEGGKDLRLIVSTEFVLAVEFTESQLQMRTYSETSDGVSIGPRRATAIEGSGWLNSLASPKRFILGLDSEPRYFDLDEPFKILELPGGADAELSIWLERREVTDP